MAGRTPPRAISSGRVPRDDHRVGGVFLKPRPGDEDNTSDLFATCIRCGCERQVAGGSRKVSDICMDCKQTLRWEATDVALPDYDADFGPPRQTVEARDRRYAQRAKNRKAAQ